MPKSLIIIPTYNELDNIQQMIPNLLERYPLDVELLIVDDNSPDGTGDFVTGISEKNPKVHILRRPGKLGLGTAYCDGFRYALERDYEYIFEMDADFSHDPAEIKNFLNTMPEHDLVIGSRYVDGVSVVHWPMRRLLLSYFANIYTRVITGMKVYDATGGFKCYRKSVLQSINLSKIRSNGYAFQIEMNFKAYKKGFSLKEIPIIFNDRKTGTSKMSKKIVYEAVWMVWKLRFQSLFGKLD